MGATNKAQMYNKCRLTASENAERYRKMYKKTTISYWVKEYRHILKRKLQRSEEIKMALLGLPLDLYFEIKSYLHHLEE